MKLHHSVVALTFALSPLSVFAGNAPAPSVRPGPAAVAAPISQVNAGLNQQAAPATVQPTLKGFSKLPGAYPAAIANGAQPAPDGTVEITINGVTLKIDSEDNVVSR